MYVEQKSNSPSKHWPSSLAGLRFLWSPKDGREAETLQKETRQVSPPAYLSPPQKQMKYIPRAATPTWGLTFPISPGSPSIPELPWKARGKGKIGLDVWVDSLDVGCPIWNPLRSPTWLKVKVAQSCLILCNPMDCIVHRILEARILGWGAISFSRGSSQPRDRTQVSHIEGREAQEYQNG